MELLETRHVKTALSTMPVKTDRNDARGIARADAAGLVPPGALQVDGRTGSARPADGAQAGAIEAVRHRDEPARHSTRFGLKVGPTTSPSFAARINHLVDGQTSLEVVAAALLSLHAVALREFKSLEKSVRQISRADARAYLDWPAYPLSDTHQVAAMRRPRTEARAGDWMTQEGLTNRGPLQKPILFSRFGI